MLKMDLHLHSDFSGTGRGSLEEVVQSAINKGFKKIGFTDQSPFPDNRLHCHPGCKVGRPERMTYQQLDEYFEEIAILKEKYKEQITIYSSVEIEYFPDQHDFYNQLKERCDYLMGTFHFIQKDNQLYSPHNNEYSLADMSYYRDDLVKTIKSGFFDFIAHPDLAFKAYRGICNQEIKGIISAIIAAAAKTGTPLEINSKGFRKAKIIDHDGVERFAFPYEPFWQIAADYKDLKVMINSDAHRPDEVGADFDLALQLVNKYGLNLITDY